jgi:hypothetical protein
MVKDARPDSVPLQAKGGNQGRKEAISEMITNSGRSACHDGK